MARVLIGNQAHAAWSDLAAQSDRQGTWAEPPAAGKGDRVVILFGYETLSDADQRIRQLAPLLGEAQALLVMPDFPDDSTYARPLLAARSALSAATLLRHAPPLEAVLESRRDVQLTRTLALSLPSRPVPLVAWADVASAAAAWWDRGAEADLWLVGPEPLTGEALASTVSAVLRETLEPTTFARLKLRELDKNGDGLITVEEATQFLATIGLAHASAAEMARQADLDGDGTISPDEFIAGLESQLAQALAGLSTSVAWHSTLPHLLRDRWTNTGLPYAQASSLTEHLAQTTAGTRTAGEGTVSAKDVLSRHALALVNLYILPGKGLMTVGEGRFGDPTPELPRLLWSSDDPQLGEPAVFTRLETPNGSRLDSRRGRTGAVEVRWRAEGSSEVLRFGEGEEARAIELSEGHIIGVACRGRWEGLRDAMVDVMVRRSLPTWQRALFRELGDIRLEHADAIDDPNEVVCNCAGVKRCDLAAAVAAGATTLTAIAAQTHATSVCGGCTPLVEEVLGSPKLKVAEVQLIEALGQGFARVTLRPAAAAPAPSRPGQHIVVQARIHGRWATRAYTLTSPAGQEVPYEITVKREEMGLFSRWLSDRAHAESLFRCSEPTGDFYLRDDDGSPIYMFGGGIGVTPGIAMIRTLSANGDPRRIHLDWSARKASDFLFEAELDAIARKHPNITWTRRCTQSEGRLDAALVASRYPFVDGAVAFLCGPDRYIAEVQAHLRAAGWPDSAVRSEVFSSRVDDEGHVKSKAPVAPAPAADAMGPAPVQHTSFFLDTRENRPVLLEAEAFLGEMYRERGLPGVLEARLQDVRQEIARTGTYTHTVEELTHGARLAWRNSTRCVGRFFWQHLALRDQRHLETEDQIFAAIVDHMRFATNGGDLISTMTVFRPGEPRIRLYNSQLIRYAGYRQPDGGFVGDPANAEVTELAIALGWQGAGTPFDILPIIIQIGDRTPRWFELPRDAVLEVALEHPTLPWFAELGLRWYALPAVSEVALDLGGVQYRCAPFSGVYMGSEIGARNLSDTNRYNLLPVVARKLGLDTTDTSALWKDRALVEINVAVLHSFRKRGVRVLDHHAASEYFLQFEKQERAAGRDTYGDWSWLVPPLSGSTSPLFFRSDLRNVIYKPMYGYQAPAWKPDASVAPEHEGPVPPCPHLRGRTR